MKKQDSKYDITIGKGLQGILIQQNNKSHPIASNLQVLTQIIQPGTKIHLIGLSQADAGRIMRYITTKGFEATIVKISNKPTTKPVRKLIEFVIYIDNYQKTQEIIDENITNPTEESPNSNLLKSNNETSYEEPITTEENQSTKNIKKLLRKITKL